MDQSESESTLLTRYLNTTQGPGAGYFFALNVRVIQQVWWMSKYRPVKPQYARKVWRREKIDTAQAHSDMELPPEKFHTICQVE